MAKFILGSHLRHKAVESRRGAQALWLVDLAFVSAATGVFRVLPLPWASALGARFGRLMGRVFRNRTRHVRANLTMVMPEAPPETIMRVAGEVWANAGAVLAEFPNLHKLGDPRRAALEVEIMERIPAYDTPGTPAVFVSAHLANWEVAALAMTGLGLRTCAMYAPLANPWLERRMLKYRRALGCALVSRDAGLRAFVDAIKAGICPIMITDRRIEGGKPVAFFGAPKATSTLPARLALRFGVPLVPVQVERLPSPPASWLRASGPRFRVRFHAPLHPADPRASPDAQAADLTRQLNARFEAFIAARPGDWLCTSKIWPASVLGQKTDIYDKM